MLAAGKWVMGIVTGGIALGAVLGTAADPDMKDPPAQWWQLTGQDEFATPSGQVFVEAWPEDLNPGGYRPDLDYEAVGWTVPAYDYDLAALAEVPLAAPIEELPTVSYGMTEAVDAAVEAEAAAEEAEAAQAPEPAAESEAAPAPEARKSELVVAGLY